MAKACSCTIRSEVQGIKVEGPAIVDCFMCNGSGMIGSSPEAQMWYKVRSHIVGEVTRKHGHLDRDHAEAMLGAYARQWSEAQRGQVKSSMGKASDRVNLYRC